MSNKPLLREELLRCLATKLDDAFLLRLFPEYAPQALRRLLAGQEAQALPLRAAQLADESGQEIRARCCCRLFTDGASRGNPGKAGAGVSLVNAAGMELAARSLYLGICTNNVAEYQALVLGLRQASELGCAEIDIFLDSELIVRQIEGRYRVKHPSLQPLYQEVRAMLVELHRWSINHVPRADNARADQLANEAIDKHGL